MAVSALWAADVFWSSLGQTFFISLFSHDIRTSLDLTHGEFGSYYALQQLPAR